VNFIEKVKKYYWKYWIYWTLLSAAIAMPNFIIFVVVAMSIGGDALNGKVEGGHYFLADHGVYTEVNYKTFLYSKIHAISVIVTHSLVFFNGFMAYLEKQWKKEKGSEE
jgi:hypothetical protein